MKDERGSSAQLHPSAFILLPSPRPLTPISRNTLIAQLCPAEPMTDPAGWHPALHE